jgi:hypothetical protein
VSSSPPDRWSWAAHLIGGEVIDQENHGWADVDPDQLDFAVVEPVDETLPQIRVALQATNGMRPVFFRRRASPWLLGGGDWLTTQCLGLERPDGTGVYLFWNDQGQLLLTDDKDGV